MAELVASRATPTAALVAAIERTPANRRPAVLVSAAGIDYYGDRRDDTVVAEDGSAGQSFLARMGQLWRQRRRKPSRSASVSPGFGPR
jgi:NAD dependent epimerase/dehydratase family enzyme